MEGGKVGEVTCGGTELEVIVLLTGKNAAFFRLTCGLTSLELSAFGMRPMTCHCLLFLQDGLDRTWSHEVASYQDDMAGVVEQQPVDDALVEEVANAIGDLEDPESKLGPWANAGSWG